MFQSFSSTRSSGSCSTVLGAVVWCYLLPDQSANIGCFERTFFLNSGEENFSPLRIMQDLYWGYRSLSFDLAYLEVSNLMSKHQTTPIVSIADKNFD